MKTIKLFAFIALVVAGCATQRAVCPYEKHTYERQVDQYGNVDWLHDTAACSKINKPVPVK